MPEETFRDFVIDQLRDLGAIVVRPMFGGHGLYLGDRFFGILFKGRLYFKTDRATQAEYASRGMRPFRPSARRTLTSYYEVPPEVLEDPDQAVAWAREAIRVAGAGSRRS